MNYRSHVSDAVIRRLPGYYRYLRELEQNGVTRISSQELGTRMGLTASQIRQDINCFGGFGQQGYGYHVSELKMRIAEILGLTQEHHVIIVGAGNIGRAVANYPSFSREGFKVQAMFDVSSALVGIDVHGVIVQPMEKLDAWLETHTVDIAVLAVPANAAKATYERLVHGGVRGVWNFAPVDLNSSDEVAVVNVHLSDTLHILSYHLREQEEAENAADE